MKDSLLTAGQFAKLARTTKRTILWYEQIGILLPVSVADNGYRLYEPRQILDFQIIALLRQLNFSLEEIESHIKGGQPLMSLFNSKKDDIAHQILRLQRMYQDLEAYGSNLADSKFLVKPQVQTISSYEIYYTPVVAPYADIRSLCAQLQAQFAAIPSDAVFLTIFEDQQYKPQAAKMRIGVIKQPGMQLRTDAVNVQAATIPAYDALVHCHQGDGSLLSLLWTEIGKYCRAHNMKPAPQTDFYELELYYPDAGSGVVDFEMHLPVVS